MAQPNRSLIDAQEEVSEHYAKACWDAAIRAAAGIVEKDLYPNPSTMYQTQYNDGIKRVASKIRGLEWPAQINTP